MIPVYKFVIAILSILFFKMNQEISYRPVYIAKISWHVGIIMQIDSKLVSHIRSLGSFNEFQYIDIGWGDEDFYESDEDFDFYLAAKAIFIPTSSVIRLQGYSNLLSEIQNHRDYLIELKLNENQFIKFCEFIEKSFVKDTNNEIILSKEKFGGIIKFYNSNRKYHLGYTCNTWVADAVKNAGFDVDPNNVITADELFFEMAKVGKVLKSAK